MKNAYGFGKTVALTQQIAALPAGTALAWVGADESDDLARFASCLVAALDPGTFAQPMRDANDVPAALWRDIPAHFLASADRYARVVLDPHSGDVAALSLAGGLLTILVAKILNGLGPLQFLLLARGLWRSGVAPVAANRRAYATMLAGAVRAHPKHAVRTGDETDSEALLGLAGLSLDAIVKLLAEGAVE